MTNPPGQPVFVEVPRPDKLHRGAYLFFWKPPSYPTHLNDNAIYSLQPTSEEKLKENFILIFISHASYYYFIVSVVNEESGSQMSEGTALWLEFSDSECRRRGGYCIRYVLCS